jgi:hypothetical protein
VCIGSKNALVSLISECFQNIENEHKSRDIEKREKVHKTIEVEVVAMERVEGRTKPLRTEARGVWKPPTIRLDDIERPHRK